MIWTEIHKGAIFMKKVIQTSAYFFTLFIMLAITGCGVSLPGQSGNQANANPYIGKWTLSHAVYNGEMYLPDENYVEFYADNTYHMVITQEGHEYDLDFTAQYEVTDYGILAHATDPSETDDKIIYDSDRKMLFYKDESGIICYFKKVA